MVNFKNFAGLLYGIPFVCVPQLSAAISEAEPKPNVIIILTDDLGYADVGFNGSTEIPTPNIDRIAHNGVQFTRGYVTHAVSGPSRAGLITGRYQDRFGFNRNPIMAPNDPAQGLPLSEQNLAEALKIADYTTAVIGKWHLGAHHTQVPLNRGFDEFFGFLGGGHDYFPEHWTISDISGIRHEYDSYRTRLMRNKGRVDEAEYLTDALSREAVSFVDRQADKGPFFLYLAYNAPHTPMQATEKYLSRFGHIGNEKRRTYAAMVSAVDDGVGLLLDKLEEKGVLDNTIIFFLSDNGGPSSDNASDNTPLRAGKGSFYEGGIRVPFAMQWSDKLPAGLVYTKPVSSLDIFATAVAHAGVKPSNELDGVDLVPFLTGDKQGDPHELLFWRHYDRQWSVVMDNTLKYHSQRDQGGEVFDLSRDIGEMNPLKLPVTEMEHFENRLDNWHSELQESKFLGLMQMNEYNRLNPDRFKLLSPYEPDTFPVVAPEGYQLVWADEFDQGQVPDDTYWSHENGFVRNDELQWYQPQNAFISDGVLTMEARREKIRNHRYEPGSDNWRLNRQYAEYTSSSINTRDKFSFQYGILEVRARLDTCMGAWPAIWTLGVDRRWPANGEIDIMEFYRINGEATILANAAWGGESRWSPVWDSAKIPFTHFVNQMPDWADRFHVWKMEWCHDYIKLYMNDQLLNTIPVENATYCDGFNPFRQPHYILLNLAIGSNGGDPANTSFPLKYEVDYVRVYQKIKE